MEPIFTLRPDVKKVCTLNVLKVAGAAALIIIIVYYTSTMVDWSIFTETLGVSEGELPSLGQLISNFLLAILVVSIITFLLSYVSVSKKQYEFFADKLEIYNNLIIFNLEKKTVMYNNVVSVRVDEESEGSVLGTGAINFELTGMDENEVKLEDITNPSQYLNKIQRLIDEDKARYTTQYQYNQEINETLDRL